MIRTSVNLNTKCCLACSFDCGHSEFHSLLELGQMQNQYASPMIEDCARCADGLNEVLRWWTFRVSLLAMEHLLAIGGVD